MYSMCIYVYVRYLCIYMCICPTGLAPT
jgi:hypothetical protein